MISQEMVNWISEKQNVENKNLLEKDLYLQELLLALANDNYFAENFVFKGGTCLTKAYLGYYRFSEDLDFTWINTKSFENQNNSQVRKLLSREINQIVDKFTKMASETGLDFKPEKSNRRYLELGGSNRFATFKLWYKPINSSTETFIKIQLNFVEKIIHSPKKILLKAIAEENKKDLQFLYPENAKPATTGPTIYCYTLEEIAAEKIRALLTRRGFKARDIIDLYMLSKKGISVNSVKKSAVEKTIFMLKYLKYAQNLKNKRFDEPFTLGNEQALLIQPIEKDFEPFMQKTMKELDIIAKEIRKT